MKNIILYLCCFFLGVGGLLGIRYQLTKTSRPFFNDPQFVILPPTGALVGRLSKSNAAVVKLRGPHDDDFKEINDGEVIKQGDSLFVEKGTGVVVLPKRTMGMEEGSELFFENLIADHVFLRQRSGTVTYEAEEPVSIRAQRSLVGLEKGSMDISMNGDKATADLTSGSARIGNIDQDNATTTYILTPGDRATLNRELQTVSIR